MVEEQYYVYAFSLTALNFLHLAWDVATGRSLNTTLRVRLAFGARRFLGVSSRIEPYRVLDTCFGIYWYITAMDDPS